MLKILHSSRVSVNILSHLHCTHMYGFLQLSRDRDLNALFRSPEVLCRGACSLGSLALSHKT